MPPKPKLTADDRDRVASALTACADQALAAAQLGVTHSTLTRYLRAHGMSGSQRTQFEARADHVSAYNAGTPVGTLANSAGVDRTTMRNALVRAGCEMRTQWSRTRGRLPSDDDVARMVALVRSGAKIRDIAKECGVAPATVSKYLKRADVEVPRKRASARTRASHRKRLYGIDDDGANERCAICGVTADSPRNNGNRTLAVDHDHVTGAVRGRLCATCNLGIAYFSDNPGLLSRAQQYVTARAWPTAADRAAQVGAAITDYFASSVEAVNDRLTVIDPCRWNIDRLRDAGFDTGDIRWALRAYHLAEPQRQLVFEPERAAALQRTIPAAQVYHARELDVVWLPDNAAANALYEQSHIQGGVRTSRFSIGLMHGDRLVAAMTFGTPQHCRSPREATLLQRFACAPGVRIPGGASRLVAAYFKAHTAPLLSYSDNRYSDGGVYRALGFTMIDAVDVDYLYYRDGRLFNKSQLQKQRLAPQGTEQTEYDLAREAGYLRIYDAGKRTWALARP